MKPLAKKIAPKISNTKPNSIHLSVPDSSIDGVVSPLYILLLVFVTVGHA
jgi:hypothetical protein